MDHMFLKAMKTTWPIKALKTRKGQASIPDSHCFVSLLGFNFPVSKRLSCWQTFTALFISNLGISFSARIGFFKEDLQRLWHRRQRFLPLQSVTMGHGRPGREHPKKLGTQCVLSEKQLCLAVKRILPRAKRNTRRQGSAKPRSERGTRRTRAAKPRSTQETGSEGGGKRREPDEPYVWLNPELMNDRLLAHMQEHETSKGLKPWQIHLLTGISHQHHHKLHHRTQDQMNVHFAFILLVCWCNGMRKPILRVMEKLVADVESLQDAEGG